LFVDFPKDFVLGCDNACSVLKPNQLFTLRAYPRFLSFSKGSGRDLTLALDLGGFFPLTTSQYRAPSKCPRIHKPPTSTFFRFNMGGLALCFNWCTLNPRCVPFPDCFRLTPPETCLLSFLPPNSFDAPLVPPPFCVPSEPFARALLYVTPPPFIDRVNVPPSYRPRFVPGLSCQRFLSLFPRLSELVFHFYSRASGSFFSTTWDSWHPPPASFLTESSPPPRP